MFPICASRMHCVVHNKKEQTSLPCDLCFRVHYVMCDQKSLKRKKYIQTRQMLHITLLHHKLIIWRGILREMPKAPVQFTKTNASRLSTLPSNARVQAAAEKWPPSQHILKKALQWLNAGHVYTLPWEGKEVVVAFTNNMALSDEWNTKKKCESRRPFTLYTL